jgi:hypothetical protein
MHIVSMWSSQEILEIRGMFPLCMVSLRERNDMNFWQLLRRLHTSWEGPWLCCGDFNEALTHDEHYGSTERPDAQILLFQECLEDCGLVDLGFTGPKYTWTNKQDSNT